MGDGWRTFHLLYPVSKTYLKQIISAILIYKHDTKWHGYTINSKKEYISPIYEEHAVIKRNKFKIQKRNTIL